MVKKAPARRVGTGSGRMVSPPNAKVMLINHCCGRLKKALEVALVDAVTADEVEVVEANHDKTVKDLKAELAKEQEVHTTVMEALEGATDLELKKKDADHAKALADAQAGHAQDLADERASSAQALVNLQTAHAAQLTRAQNFHLAQLAAAEVRVATWRARARRAQRTASHHRRERDVWARR